MNKPNVIIIFTLFCVILTSCNKERFKADAIIEKQIGNLKFSYFWFQNKSTQEYSTGLAVLGNHPQIMVSQHYGTLEVDGKNLVVPRDGFLYILAPDMTVIKTDDKVLDIINENYRVTWANKYLEKNELHWK